MAISDYIINDIKPLNVNDKIGSAQELFNQLTYSHIPIQKDGIYIGCISETDAHCFDSEQLISDTLHSLEGFYIRESTLWLDILEVFAQNDTNIMPVLNNKNVYLGYYELNDIISLFKKTPFFSEPGGLLIIEKGYNDYSFSEVSQIIESNNAKLLGLFISRIQNDIVQLTIKIGHSGLNEIIQSFRRYGYNIISGHADDSFISSLKERSDYLDKYLNL
ncbi:CBS domain-containing protein [Flavobacteriaceae bacterium AU392]|nr:CBS domain-containing protein [Flavobacteriaceae bacterium]RKM81610.1 CBS domain-containing protein [Flavobacteriaceae bacterium AU392]